MNVITIVSVLVYVIKKEKNMEGYLFRFLVFLILLPVFFSCNDDNNSPIFGDTRVTVKVKNSLGKSKAGNTVYMFFDEEIANSTSPGSALGMLVTGETGKVVFDLNLEDMDSFASQEVMLCFAVFNVENNETMIAGSTSVKVKKGDVKKVELKILP